MSSASATAEIDQLLKKTVKLMHSTHPNSATELRMLLDEVIKQRYGPEKMLCNTLSKRHLDAEANFPGMVPIPPPQQQQQQPPSQQADEVINLTNSPAKTISDSPDTIMDSDDGISGTGIAADGGGSTMLTTGDDDGNLKDFGDLNCCVCGEMMFTATNRLIECSKCGALYHQECHKPPITDEETSEDQEHNWQCDTCCNKPSTSKAAGIVVIPDEPISLVAKTKSSATSSRSSSSSNSSSPFCKQEPTATSVGVATPVAATSSLSKHHHHKSSSSSSSKSHKEERASGSSSKTGGGGSSSSVVAPAVSVISSTEKNSSHSSSSSSSSSKKPSSHSSSLKSSSSKSSKHHDSSSKRKNK